jgi:arylformamidase
VGIVGGVGKLVFREYDQGALDAEYNNREKVEDSADWIARYPAASAETRAALKCRLDLAYGTHPGETLDVFPARSAPAPVHVFVHGGYWQRLDKADSSFVARGLQPAGAVVVVINYALIPTVNWTSSSVSVARRSAGSIAMRRRSAATRTASTYRATRPGDIWSPC